MTSPLPTDPLLTATVAEWHQDKGYGFLELDGTRIFLHRRDLAGGGEPRAGDRVRFRMGKDEQGRPCAQRAVCRGAGFRKLRGQVLLVVALLVLPAAAVIQQGLGHWLVLLYAVVLSIITYQMYARDKEAAQTNQWRISEVTLHAMALIGGWPGAWIAQVRLRHKSAKRSFLAVFWFIVVLYQYLSLEFFLHWRLTRWLWAGMTGQP